MSCHFLYFPEGLKHFIMKMFPTLKTERNRLSWDTSRTLERSYWKRHFCLKPRALTHIPRVPTSALVDQAIPVLAVSTGLGWRVLDRRLRQGHSAHQGQNLFLTEAGITTQSPNHLETEPVLATESFPPQSTGQRGLCTTLHPRSVPNPRGDLIPLPSLQTGNTTEQGRRSATAALNARCTRAHPEPC